MRTQRNTPPPPPPQQRQQRPGTLAISVGDRDLVTVRFQILIADLVEHFIRDLERTQKGVLYIAVKAKKLLQAARQLYVTHTVTHSHT